MLTIYKTEKCAYCVMVMKYLDMKKAEYTVVDITNDLDTRLELQKKFNMTTVPITTNGEKAVAGYNIARLNELLV